MRTSIQAVISHLRVFAEDVEAGNVDSRWTNSTDEIVQEARRQINRWEGLLIPLQARASAAGILHRAMRDRYLPVGDLVISTVTFADDGPVTELPAVTLKGPI